MKQRELFTKKALKEVDSIREVFECWQKVMGYERRRFTYGRKQKIRARLRTFTVNELKKAILVASNDPWWRGKNDRNTPYDDIMNIFRNDERVELFLERKESNEDDLLPDDVGDLF